MNAPLPTFTSSTIASAPPATFFEMIEPTMSGTDGTVPVTSRSAYIFLSAGSMSGDCAMTATPTRQT